MTTATEVWVPVMGYQGWYEVSSLGRFRKIRRSAKGHSKNFTDPLPILLTPLLYQKGYYKYHLSSCDGEMPVKRQYAHRMVYEAFHGPIPDGMQINHRDANKANNAIDNLETVTDQQNQDHAYKNNLRRWPRKGGGWTYPSLTADDVREVRRAYAAGEATQRELAARLNISQSNVGNIVRRQSWKWLK